jgi:hypothetical protein
MSINQLKQLSIRDASLNLRCEKLESTQLITNGVKYLSTPASTSIDYINWTPITQTGTYTTAITANVSRAVLITQSVTLGPLATAPLIWNNNLISLGDIVKVHVQSYDGNYASGGRPTLICNGVASGIATLEWINWANTACSGGMLIYLELVKYYAP